MSDKPPRGTYWIPTEQQTGKDAQDMQSWTRQRFQTWRGMTTEERQEEYRRRQDAAAAVRDRVTVEHNRVMAAASGVAAKVLELHAPYFHVDIATDEEAKCGGCDPGAHAEGPASHPCETYELVRDYVLGESP